MQADLMEPATTADARAGKYLTFHIVNEETRQRILEAISSLGYVANTAARGLRDCSAVLRKWPHIPGARRSRTVDTASRRQKTDSFNAGRILMRNGSGLRAPSTRA